MKKLRLPIGIQTFRTMREEGYYYVDKTPYLRRLVENGTHYFLSRPRRFGKSLLADTLKELFEGSEELFEGLSIHGHWDWSVRHPVVRLSFGQGVFDRPEGVQASAMAQLQAAAEDAGIAPRHDTAPERFADLLRRLHRASGRRVVVLVDEYDKPILDALAAPETARANRDFLRGLYGVVKDSDAHVYFAFVTGVSKFSKVSLLSGLNNLLDITLHPAYSAICGYAQADLDAVFAAELPGLDRDAIRAWYNGYCWRGEPKVCNPFDILLLFESREFRAHWFETASPRFLIDMLAERGVGAIALERMAGEDSLLSQFDVDDIGTEALLFQTGYLTILGETCVGGRTVYRLGYPNREVKQSLNDQLLQAMGSNPGQRLNHDASLLELLAAGNCAGLEALFKSFLAGIPYQWHTRGGIARCEGCYASLFHAWFAAVGVDPRAEDSSSGGRADIVVRHAGRVYVFEFKVLERAGAGAALAQIEARRYADKYRAAGEPIHLIGVELSSAERNIVAFDVASDA